MALLVLVTLFFLPIFLLSFLQKCRKNTSAKFPPGPRGLPIIGNLYQFDTTNIGFYLWKLSKQYGPIFSLRLGFRPSIVISSSKLAKKAFKTHDLQFAGRPVLLGPKTLTYNYSGVTFAPHYNEWRDMRKRFVTSLLNSNRIEQFRGVRKDEIFRMVEKISKLGDAADEDGSSKAPINLSKIAMTSVFSTIFRVIFSKRLEDDGPTGVNRLDYLLAETQLLSGTFFFSDCSFSFIGNWLDRITGMHRRLQKHFKDCDQYYQQLIDDHLDSTRPKVAGQQRNLIDDLLSLTKAGDLTLVDVKAAIVELFIGATNPSKVTIEMAMTHLMKNPQAMKKAQEEVRSVVKDKGFVDEDDIPRLEYLKAVVKETMRVQPASQFISKATTERCVIDSYHIPAKTMVFVNVWAIGRDPQVWDKPDKFIPERFVGSNMDMGGQNFEFIPFGVGRRICPGIPIAVPSVELTLANLLYKFDWKMPHGMKIDDLDFEATPGFTQHRKKPLKLMAAKFI